MKSCLKQMSAVIGATALATTTLPAATYVVSSTADSGGGTLRQAILDANSGGGGDIVFSNTTGAITLASPLPLIIADVNILGPGTNLLTVSGSNQFSVFALNAGTTNTISNFTIANAYGDGAMIFTLHGEVPAISGCAISNSGTLTVSDCVISNCVNSGEGAAGAVFNGGTLTMQGCLFVNSGSWGEESGVEGGCVLNTGYLGMSGCVLTNCTASDGAGIFNSGTAQLQNCLLAGLEDDDSEGNGGAIESDAGAITLASCTITNCAGGWDGGAMAVYGGSLIMTNTVMANNSAGFEAGGLLLFGSNSLYGCTISGCMSGEDGGGGIKNVGSTALVNCTVSGNTSTDGEGGGIYNMGTLKMTNCTVSGNQCSPVLAGYGGGGILNETNDVGGEYRSSSATLWLTDCTVVSNTAGTGPGGGIQNTNGGVTYATDTIIADNLPADFAGVVDSAAYNLIKNTNGCTLTGNLTGNLYGVDPLLGPLENNGGLVNTHALLTGSPAIDAGPANAAPNFDERGVSRPQGAADDIGAFEYGSVPRPVLIALTPSGDGCFHVQFGGVPGFAYTLQRASSPIGPWSTFGSATATINGTVACTDTAPPAGNAFYRAVYQGR